MEDMKKNLSEKFQYVQRVGKGQGVLKAILVNVSVTTNKTNSQRASTYLL